MKIHDVTTGRRVRRVIEFDMTLFSSPICLSERVGYYVSTLGAVMDLHRSISGSAIMSDPYRFLVEFTDGTIARSHKQGIDLLLAHTGQQLED